MSNERHDLPTLNPEPLNLSMGQLEELQVIAYLVRMVVVGLEGEAVDRLKTLAHFFELETEEAQRLYKFARQRALDPARIRQAQRGIVIVNDGEVQALQTFTQKKT